MDTQAQHSERDRATPESPHGEDPGQRSRSARVSGSPPRSPQSGYDRIRGVMDRLPGGRMTAIVLLCGVCVLLAGRLAMQPFEIPSGSMEPGLRAGDRVLVNKLAYRFGAQPQRGDVVVFDGTGYFGGADYIKRVVGVGGDHVVCCDGQKRIEVNGIPVVEDRYLYPGDVPSRAPFDVRVPDGTLFLLGDHRSTSRDSRDRLGAPGGGMVPVSAVIGRAAWVVWPVGHWDTAALKADGGDRRARDGQVHDRVGPRASGAATRRVPMLSGPVTPPGGAHG